MRRFESEFRELQGSFLESARRRVDDMTRELERLDQPAGASSAGSNLFRHVHAFAGLGASYGFPEISRIGESGEQIADELMNHDAASRSDALFQLQLIVESLRDALQRAELAA